MSLRFVKTAVLSSEDGVDFSKETAIENEETRLARLDAERASRKSLYEQLEEQKQKKQADYEAVTKQIFAPPKALDDEEFDFLQSMSNQKSRKEEEVKLKEQQELEDFRESLKNSR
jgi:predicted patatin/cPLA2 family phospholipase